jgi:hypothetical protein
MTLFVRLLDVPVDEKAARLHDAIRNGGTATTHRDMRDMSNVPGAAFVYWLQPCLLDLFKAISRWDDFESRCGLGTLDDFRFLRLWWEVPAGDVGWVPFAKGGRYSPFHPDVVLRVNWHGGTELKASVERKVGSASRKVQGQEFYFREGLTWPYLPHILGSFQLLPRGCIYSGGGPGIFSKDQEALQPLCAVLNSAPFLFLLECLMPRGSEGGQTLKYETGYVTSVPLPDLSPEMQASLAKIADEGWQLGYEKACFNETSLRFTGPAYPGARAVLDAKMAKVLATCDAVVGEALNLDASGLDEIDAWARIRRSQASSPIDKEERTSCTETYLSWCVGQAFGRFSPIGPVAEHDPCRPFDPLPAMSPAAASATTDAGFTMRGILVDDRGHHDDIVAAVSQFVEHDTAGVHHLEPDGLRDRIAQKFFADHLATYTAYRRKAPIYWQLATPSASYSVWLYYPRLTADTLYRVHADYARPKLLHERSTLDKLLADVGASPTAAQRKEVERQRRFVEELQAFVDDLARLTPVWAPKLDDGVIVNFAPLWRLVGHNKSWQKELATTWRALSEGKYDWAGIALRLWPERVVTACVEDRSLAIAHGLAPTFWAETASGKWALKSVPDRSVEEVAAALTVPAIQDALALLGVEAEAPVRRTRRRT